MMARGTARSNQRPDTLIQDRKPTDRRKSLATHVRTIHCGLKYYEDAFWSCGPQSKWKSSEQQPLAVLQPEARGNQVKLNSLESTVRYVGIEVTTLWP
jgi:hypothetical protein